MKKIFFLLTILLCRSICIIAQEDVPQLENNTYIYKTVVAIEGRTQNQLYFIAHNILSDWAGPSSNSKISIEFDDRESGVLMSKGSVFLGYKKVNLMCGYNTFMDFTLIIRCKDEKAQIIIKVPSMSFEWSCGAENETAPITQILPYYTYSGTLYYLDRPAKEFSPRVFDTMKGVVANVAESLKKDIFADDDF